MNRQTKHHIFMGIIALMSIAFAVLTYFAHKNAYFPFDLTITKGLQSITFTPFKVLMEFLTFLGNGVEELIITIFGVALLVALKYKREALFLGISTVGSALITHGVKVLVGRARPDPELIYQATHRITYSFPSGHVLFYIGFFGFLIFLAYTLFRKSFARGVSVSVLMLMILLIGPSRIYVGEHWFSDVIGAYLIGFVWLTIIIWIYHTLTSKKS